MEWQYVLVGAAALAIGLALGYLLARRQAPAAPPPAPAPAPPSKRSTESLRLLGLLQREGRLVDFLMEDIQPYQDAQVGAAVREIHRNCRKVLNEQLTIEPVRPEAEGDRVTVPAGFDPSAVRLLGNVTGQPPFTGTLHHRGWRVRDWKLPAPAEGQDERVLMPAEVELA
jgi:hypothetical protein